MTFPALVLAALVLVSTPPAAGPERMPEGRGRGDLDGDGIPECWRLEYDGGSGYGWFELRLRPGCAGRAATIRLGGSFGSFCDIANIHGTLTTPLLDGLVDRWLGAGVRRPLAAIDGSLAWLIERYQFEAHDTSIRPDTSPHDYTPRWQPGTPSLPPDQAVLLLSADEQRFARELGGALTGDTSPKIRGPALFVYNAFNHGPLKEAARAGGLTVYVTNHAVAVRDDARGAWSWGFVGTDQMKLRFPTTVKAVTDGKLVAVERSVFNEGVTNNHVVVIDPRAGRYVVVPLRAGKRWSLDADLARRLEGSPVRPRR